MVVVLLVVVVVEVASLLVVVVVADDDDDCDVPERRYKIRIEVDSKKSIRISN